MGTITISTVIKQHVAVVMQERKVAVDSLMAIARQLHSAHHALADKLVGRQDLPDHYTLDLFYQSVKSSSDVQDFILRTAGSLSSPVLLVSGFVCS